MKVKGKESLASAVGREMGSFYCLCVPARIMKTRARLDRGWRKCTDRGRAITAPNGASGREGVREVGQRMRCKRPRE